MDDGTASEDVADGEADVSSPPRRWRRVIVRILLGLGVTILALAALAGVLYAFGTMQTPAPEVSAAYEAGFPPGKAPRVEWRVHIPIPGCTCHSSDPRVQVEHSGYYIRECARCHAGA